MNIIVGDNEAGKSTILEAIDLVISGNIRKVENIGIDRIINTDSIDEFLKGSKKYDELPVVRIELFLNGDFGFEIEGKNNSDEVTAYGIRMVCAPNPLRLIPIFFLMTIIQCVFRHLLMKGILVTKREYEAFLSIAAI